jgi:hypothetical protein
MRGAKNMAYLAKEYDDPKGAERLFLAVVNQAVSDVLENMEEAKEAEQWLLSKEFDDLVALLSRDAEAVRQRQQRSVA